MGRLLVRPRGKIYLIVSPPEGNKRAFDLIAYPLERALVL